MLISLVNFLLGLGEVLALFPPTPLLVRVGLEEMLL